MARGVGALTIQGIAEAGGASKALVLYHFHDKATLLRALDADLTARSTARLAATARAADPFAAWRALALAEVRDGELALLAALGKESDVRMAGPSNAAGERAAAAADLFGAIVAGFDLSPRVELALGGQMLLRHLDGLAVRRDDEPPGLEAEVDAFALALLALGD